MQVLADAKQTAERVSELARWVAPLQIEHPDSGGNSGGGGGGLALVGIRSRGDVIARRVAEQNEIADVGVLDITLYRDDLSEAAAQPVVRTTEIGFPIDGRDVVLIDDVLMSGRSVRAALSVLMDFGRPRRVWLAVLVDRGTAVRELPIAADFAALTHDGPQQVAVRLTPTDDEDAVVLEEA